MNIRHKKWTDKKPPAKVLFIRLQAMGDVTITFPYINGFHKAYPEVDIHFLTREEDAGVPLIYPMFSKVLRLKGGRNKYLQYLYGLLLIPVLLKERYDVVYDLQNHRLSRVIRFFLRARAWAAFDRFSPIPAGDRTYETIKAVGLDQFNPDFSRNETALKIGKEVLDKYEHSKNLIIINPAGFFESRNWPESNYQQWAELMMSLYQGEVTFLFVGIDRIKKSADNFEKKFPNHTLNLVNKTTAIEAFSIVQNASFMLTEDSGLMHMAWVSGVKTLAIFGSSRSDWSRPLGDHSYLMGSADMECGNCLLNICKFNDNRCLTRYNPEMVFEQTKKLLKID